MYSSPSLLEGGVIDVILTLESILDWYHGGGKDIVSLLPLDAVRIYLERGRMIICRLFVINFSGGAMCVGLPVF